MLRRMRLGTKVTVALCVMALIPAGVGLVGTRGLGRLEGSLRELTDSRLAGLAALELLSAGQRAMVLGEQGLVTEGGLEEHLRRVEEGRAQARRARALYEPLFRSPEEETRWGRFETAWEGWVREHERVVSLAGESAAGGEGRSDSLWESAARSRARWAECEQELGELVAVARAETEAACEAAAGATRRVRALLGSVVGVGVAACMVLGMAFSRNIAGILGSLLAEGQRVTEAARVGRLGARGEAERVNFEFGGMIRGINETLDAVVRPIEEARDVLAALARKDLTARMVGEYAGDFAAIGESVNAAAEALHQVVLETRGAVGQVTRLSRQVAAGAQEAGRASERIAETIEQVAKGASEQTRSVAETARAMEQLNEAIAEVARGAQAQARHAQDTNAQMNQISRAIEQVARSAQSAAGGAQQVAHRARAGGEAVEKAVGGMGRIAGACERSGVNVRALGESSQQIGEIVDMIAELAEQTNLLALNAAIEAARAGEHGRGFAVVADEVRRLAERSARATKEIGALVKGMQAGVQEAVASMEEVGREVARGSELSQEAGAALEEILASVDSVAGQAEEVSAAAQQMAAGAAEVVKSVENISAVTQQSTASTEQMSANSAEVTRSVEQISAISRENAAAAEAVSAAAGQQHASVEAMSASAQEVAKVAEELQRLVGRFELGEGERAQGGGAEVPGVVKV